ncbi:hypothetical protein acdb102_31910 [Acidothermaceae bacterium B102]|nr:hypothetical protein acdb102_31910 [Acidothermaceae bacterium B102]
MSDPVVRVHYRRSGGIAGLALVADVAAADLPPADAQTVAGLVDHPPAPAPQGRVPDEFTHELTLRTGSGEQAYVWGDTQVPDEVRPLLASLRALAAPSPR